MQTGPTLRRSLEPIRYLKASPQTTQTNVAAIKSVNCFIIAHKKRMMVLPGSARAETLSINITSWHHVQHKNLTQSHFSSCPKNNYNKSST